MWKVFDVDYLSDSFPKIKKTFFLLFQWILAPIYFSGF